METLVVVGAASAGITQIAEDIGAIVTAAYGWITTAISQITASGNELLMFACIVPFVGLGIGLLHRIIKTKA